MTHYVFLKWGGVKLFYWNGNTSRAGVANMRFDTFRVRDENKEKIKEKRHKGRK